MIEAAICKKNSIFCEFGRFRPDWRNVQSQNQEVIVPFISSLHSKTFGRAGLSFPIFSSLVARLYVGTGLGSFDAQSFHAGVNFQVDPLRLFDDVFGTSFTRQNEKELKLSFSMKSPQFA